MGMDAEGEGEGEGERIIHSILPTELTGAQ